MKRHKKIKGIVKSKIITETANYKEVKHCLATVEVNAEDGTAYTILNFYTHDDAANNYANVGDFVECLGVSQIGYENKSYYFAKNILVKIKKQ